MNKLTWIIIFISGINIAGFCQSDRNFYPSDSIDFSLDQHINYGFGADRQQNPLCALTVKSGKEFYYPTPGTVGDESSLSYSFWFYLEDNLYGDILTYLYPNPQRKALNLHFVWLKGPDTLLMGSNIKKIKIREWHHLVVAIKNQRRTIYLNAEEISEGPTSAPYLFGDMIFNHFYGSFNGRVDDFTIYKSFIDLKEVQALYAAPPSCSQALGLNDPQENFADSGELIIYPNPSAGSFQVSSKQTIQKINVFTSTGTSVYSGIPKEINDLSPGMYLVEAFLEKGVKRKKVLVTD